MRTRVHWRGVAAFVLTAYGLMWLVCLPLWLSGRGLATPGAFGLITIGMFTPALASWGVCRFVERTPWLTRVGVRSGRPADVLRYAGLGFGLATGGLVVAAALAGVAGLVAWDVIDLSGVRTYLGSLPTGAGPLPSPAVLLLLGVLGTVIATFSVNGFAALGEEVGWRGYLVPALLPLGRGPALVVSGVVWALWHSPIVLLGFNYPGSPRAGAMATFVGFCVLSGRSWPGSGSGLTPPSRPRWRTPRSMAGCGSCRCWWPRALRRPG